MCCKPQSGWMTSKYSNNSTQIFDYEIGSWFLSSTLLLVTLVANLVCQTGSDLPFPGFRRVLREPFWRHIWKITEIHFFWKRVLFLDLAKMSILFSWKMKFLQNFVFCITHKLLLHCLISILNLFVCLKQKKWECTGGPKLLNLIEITLSKNFAIRSFTFIFGLFQTNNTIFTTNQAMWKICIWCLALKFEPTTSWTQIYTHNHKTCALSL